MQFSVDDQFVAGLQWKHFRLEKQPVEMFFVGMHRGAELHPFDYQPFVEAVGELLKYDAVLRDAAHELPESGRAAAHNTFIVMVIRPDSVSGAIQHAASDDVEAESQNEIQIVFFDFLDVDF